MAELEGASLVDLADLVVAFDALDFATLAALRRVSTAGALRLVFRLPAVRPPGEFPLILETGVYVDDVSVLVAPAGRSESPPASLRGALVRTMRAARRREPRRP